MRCPHCGNELTEEKSPDGFFYSCHKCGGRLINLHLLQKFEIPPSHYSVLDDAAKSEPASLARECPACRRKMAECKLSAKKEITLDICSFCRMVWFDPSEFRMLRFNPPKFHPVELPPECKEAFALALVKDLEKNKSNCASSGGDDNASYSTEWLGAVLGLPVVEDAPSVEKTPALTWGLAGFIGLFYLAILWAGIDVVNELGFVSADPFRAYGLTIVTSFFTHVNFFHVVINLYFLMIFGERIEDTFGRIKFVALIFFAHVAGLFLYSYLAPNSVIPCYGASSAILGILAFYAVVFPDAGVGIWLRSYGHSSAIERTSIPAYFFLIIYIGLLLWKLFFWDGSQLPIDYYFPLGGLVFGVFAAIICWLRLLLKNKEAD